MNVFRFWHSLARFSITDVIFWAGLWGHYGNQSWPNCYPVVGTHAELVMKMVVHLVVVLLASPSRY